MILVAVPGADSSKHIIWLHRGRYIKGALVEIHEISVMMADIQLFYKNISSFLGFWTV